MEELTLTHPDDWHLYLRNNMGKLNLTAEIAKQLRVFHQVDIPGSKEPQLWNELFKFYENDEPAMYRIEDDLVFYPDICSLIHFLRKLHQTSARVMFVSYNSSSASEKNGCSSMPR
ncbi:hypothetical protein Tsubulata_004393 [Turnera subulata]|uniref:Uncharacterized protein n=1 Tax=Turnera subulata TaxID=218843 RepID=A0A9Q0F0P9_9ROSI|nr:hypothetical protein Tsubulata_017918 [Turnera subulata]KAJ4829059.1 hypothetical protein Tsubulata_004393 [Turnera subulata]